ncbi:sodium- and chloride-dependent GABA transporter 2-like isoform X1 [Anguilla anguilla]|uniref:sodium- and chloride-dependent GABA transporter 2-like isoform X1 n=1 Tax=Anguilla anguilla TaxID=7936 RepID=UPI0015AAB52A|nr:sodium- and chloride-dependent GABA transporter 2-like isoform X1 [Anguilla anguilla]XP_035241054.1 sodium- and chloride-dependent GABA transporter 2-like isoform X1 [Anguilla anguilla]XP_035241055.1 sodium- and chloride-dependent GABA transporter 2-like isoform X1 [Anguilla anguilla]XP_035241056.1 sodium- and chloride-dependent GABA transporter 2-like isoform X1 [Anguilla anguilla]
MKKERETAERPLEERGQWGSKVEFLLAVAGNIVGLGNVWRFPYLCYKNGGGAFLVPYLLFAVTCGIPLFLLETAMGQYTQEGGITCWRKLCPLAEGIGYAGQLIQFYGCMCYIVILAWALFYLYFSFSSQLPWASCSNTWNSDHCVDFSNRNLTTNWTQQPNNSSSAATEFWERRVLAISGGIEEVGSVRWEVLLCLIIMWVICYFCIWKGVKSTGKVVYFTATFPYLMLLVLLIRGLTLPGALQGVVFYLYPDPSHLTDPQVWMEAGSQIIFSYSLGAGALTVLGSYNTYNNNCYRDCFWLCLLNSGTSVVAGFAVFSVLGFMAHEQGVAIEEVAESGPGLAFIAYPQAVAMMPLPQLWAVCFFIMIILLGLDSQFVGMEGVITSVTDMFPTLLRRAGHREIFVLLFCLSCFILQLVMVTQGGMYVFQLFDYYAFNGACVFFLCVFEVLAMGWLFGAERMVDAIEDMTGERPCLIFKLCWLYFTPLVTLGSFIFYVVDYQPLTFNRWYVYPDWAYVLGWLLALSSVVLVPGWSLVKLSLSTGTLRQRLSHLCHPDDDLPLTRKQMAERELAISATEMEELVTNQKSIK